MFPWKCSIVPRLLLNSHKFLWSASLFPAWKDEKEIWQLLSHLSELSNFGVLVFCSMILDDEPFPLHFIALLVVFANVVHFELFLPNILCLRTWKWKLLAHWNYPPFILLFSNRPSSLPSLLWNLALPSLFLSFPFPLSPPWLLSLSSFSHTEYFLKKLKSPYLPTIDNGFFLSPPKTFSFSFIQSQMTSAYVAHWGKVSSLDSVPSFKILGHHAILFYLWLLILELVRHFWCWLCFIFECMCTYVWMPVLIDHGVHVYVRGQPCIHGLHLLTYLRHVSCHWPVTLYQHLCTLSLPPISQ